MRKRPRPRPQSHIDKKYMRRGIEKTMVLADPIYLGHAPSISMHVRDLITLTDDDEIEAEEFASNIIAKHMKEICKFCDIIIVTDEPYANKDSEIENHADKLGADVRQVSIREKDAHQKASSLVLFANELPKLAGPIMRRIETVLDGCIAAGKPVCVIDSFGVKRYPRK